MSLAKLYLKKQQDRRLKAGHLWIYNNEIDTKKSPLQNFSAGEVVTVISAQEQILGNAYINPKTLLAARLLTRNQQENFDQDFITARIRQAFNLRNQLFSAPFYRLVYGESDDLPGLLIDRYDDVYVVQITTAGMERMKTEIVTALVDVVQPHSILWRNDHSMRAIEGLAEYVEAAFGNPPELIELRENQLCFHTSVWQGQKTGWFYDHRDNRFLLQKLVAGKRVLDVFSYIGAWGIQAAVAGASEVHCVDASEKAIGLLKQNAQLNKVADRIQTYVADAFEQLKLFHQNKQQFDVIVIDPPAFIKRRKDMDAGVIAYQRINDFAMRLLASNGLLVSSSCSLHLSNEQLKQIILRSSVKYRRFSQILHEGQQGMDHPVHPAISETRYLKALFCWVR